MQLKDVNSWKKRIFLLTSVALLSSMGLLLSWWCFRKVVSIDDTAGFSEYRRSWCWCNTISHDWNHDGTTDFAGRLQSTWRSISTHEPLVSHQESSRCDGVFDVQVAYDSNGKLQSLSADLDRDGLLELVGKGEVGVKLLDEVRSSSCYPK